MARARYIWRNGDWLDITNYVRPPPKGPMIMRDVDPYRSVVTGEMIGGRRQHRDHLRDHGCIEVGNEPLRGDAVKPYQPTGVADDVVRAMAELGN